MWISKNLMVIPSTISYFMSIFKEAVEGRIEDSRGRLVRLIKCTYFESKGTHKAAVQKPTHLGYQMEMWYGDPHRIYASYKKEIKNWPVGQQNMRMQSHAENSLLS